MVIPGQLIRRAHKYSAFSMNSSRYIGWHFWLTDNLIKKNREAVRFNNHRFIVIAPNITTETWPRRDTENPIIIKLHAFFCLFQKSEKRLTYMLYLLLELCIALQGLVRKGNWTTVAVTWKSEKRIQRDNLNGEVVPKIPNMAPNFPGNSLIQKSQQNPPQQWWTCGTMKLEERYKGH